jgi:hypothetical protein
VGETFLLFEKITSPTHYANFASLICFVRRGIRYPKGQTQVYLLSYYLKFSIF